MKIVLRNLKTGKLSLAELPPPQLESQGVIVRNLYSLISAGTERGKVSLDQKGILGKARARPDLVREVIQKVRDEGLLNTIKAVRARLGTPTPLGYSCAGIVMEAGEMVPDLRAGDLVACSGGGWANHAEVVYVPRNLAAPVPKGLDPKVAATAGVGAIALQGARRSGAKVGEAIAVIGLGLIGQMSCQILSAAGCRVIGIDIDTRALDYAAKACPGAVLLNSVSVDVEAAVLDATGSLGADATIICAVTKDAGPINLSARITREQGKVVALGLVNMDLPREEFFRKELSLVISRSLGPGRFDKGYEEHALDYPAAYVRWTEGRNMSAYLQLAAEGKIDPAKLLTHEFAFEDVVSAYDLITNRDDDFHLGVMLRYDAEKEFSRQSVKTSEAVASPRAGAIGIGLIGAGNYAIKFILPYLKNERLRGVLSGSGLSARSVVNKFAFEEIAAEPEQVIEDPDTELVLITTRHSKHAGHTVKALEAGKAVFVEKPLCLTLKELRDISRAYREDSFLHVGFNRRFSPSVAAVAEHLGDCRSNLLMSFRVNAGPLHDHWLQDPAVGGGRLIGEGCHYIDLMRYFSGSPVSRVSCSGVRKPGSEAIECEDFSITLEFENGSIGTIVYSGQGSKALAKERHEFYAGGKSAVIDNYRTVLLFEGNKRKKLKGGRDKGQAEQMRRILEGLRRGEQPIPFEQMIEVALATFAAVESLTRAAPVEMAEMWRQLEAE